VDWLIPLLSQIRWKEGIFYIPRNCEYLKHHHH